mmetsp:Transcript_5232/g.6733  ORF Transcript_5232/g.6733 Transcript_5232/m.6733 type:complete len:202 (+) Transcript_5232:69-674(+)
MIKYCLLFVTLLQLSSLLQTCDSKDSVRAVTNLRKSRVEAAFAPERFLEEGAEEDAAVEDESEEEAEEEEEIEEEEVEEEIEEEEEEIEGDDAGETYYVKNYEGSYYNQKRNYYNNNNKNMNNNQYGYNDDATANSNTGSYVNTHVNKNYTTTPDVWDFEDWFFFVMGMILFGLSFCMSCLFFWMPCCCPSVMKGYAKLLH